MSGPRGGRDVLLTDDEIDSLDNVLKTKRSIKKFSKLNQDYMRIKRNYVKDFVYKAQTGDFSDVKRWDAVEKLDDALLARLGLAGLKRHAWELGQKISHTGQAPVGPNPPSDDQIPMRFHCPSSIEQQAHHLFSAITEDAPQTPASAKTTNKDKEYPSPDSDDDMLRKDEVIINFDDNVRSSTPDLVQVCLKGLYKPPEKDRLAFIDALRIFVVEKNIPHGKMDFFLKLLHQTFLHENEHQ